MIKQCLFLFFLLGTGIFSPMAQTFTETAQLYPLGIDGNKYVVSGFVPFENLKDEEIYAHALLWTVENICPRLRERITAVDIPSWSFGCDLILTSVPGSGNDIYYCKALFRVAAGKLTYYLSDIKIESSVLVMKKITPIEKLSPEKKEAHKQSMDNFVQAESRMLNKMFDFIATHSSAPVTHWKEIGLRKPVKGMTEDECRMAFGKPQTVMETSGEVQWMYSSSFYLFFKDGCVQTVIK